MSQKQQPRTSLPGRQAGRSAARPHTYICIYVYIYCICIHMYIYIYMNIHTCIYIRLHVKIYIERETEGQREREIEKKEERERDLMHIQINTYICTYVYIYIYILPIALPGSTGGTPTTGSSASGGGQRPQAGASQRPASAPWQALPSLIRKIRREILIAGCLVIT